MRVLINAASSHMGGALTYLQNILQWIPKVAPDDHFLVFLPISTKHKLSSNYLHPKIELKYFPYENTGGILRLLFDQFYIPKIIKQKEIDVLFSATGFGTFRKRCPEVILVRNPVYFSLAFQNKYRELGRSLVKNSLRRWYSLISIKKADHILFPTKAMKSMVEDYIALTDKRTRAIHYGFDKERFFSDGKFQPEVVHRINEWKKNNYRILLNVSTYAVHKNFETLIDAVNLLKKDGYKVKLLTTTSREKTSDKREYDALRNHAAQVGVLEDWYELGYIPYQQLHNLYRFSDIYVFPSFTESFGHSLVEAMACGLPILAADMPVNREVCGTAGYYFSIFSPQKCAKAMKNILNNESEKNQLIQASHNRSKHFSWECYTDELINLLRENIVN